MKIEKTKGSYYWAKCHYTVRPEIVFISNTQQLYRVGSTTKYDPKDWTLMELIKSPTDASLSAEQKSRLKAEKLCPHCNDALVQDGDFLECENCNYQTEV